MNLLIYLNISLLLYSIYDVDRFYFSIQIGNNIYDFYGFTYICIANFLILVLLLCKYKPIKLTIYIVYIVTCLILFFCLCICLNMFVYSSNVFILNNMLIIYYKIPYIIKSLQIFFILTHELYKHSVNHNTINISEEQYGILFNVIFNYFRSDPDIFMNNVNLIQLQKAIISRIDHEYFLFSIFLSVKTTIGLLKVTFIVAAIYIIYRIFI